MTAPLFDVKAKFSEYVTMAENGEIVAVTKHGKTSVLLISQETLEQLTSKSESFSEHYRKWRRDCGEEIDDSYSAFLEGCRNISGSVIENPFGGEE
ncbi:MAG: type II toxin-antitoxin system prevent-host-death family antitoxin [Treponema sp.]|nr:type II toxin-antitoxin system prevent-host-death family antitoxin [Treponema sp.]